MFGEILFLLSAVLTLVGALMVVSTKSLMHSCVYLLATLFGVAGLYVCIGADFLAATQLVVYAGGVIILMLFAIMLTGGSDNQPNKFGFEKVPSMGNKKTFAVAVFSMVVAGLVSIKILSSYLQYFEQGKLPALTHTSSAIGKLLMTDHILAFEISSVLLLGALVGAAVIARPTRG